MPKTFDRGHALIIGVGHLKYVPQASLPSDVAEAMTLRDVLCKSGYPMEQVCLLHDEAADRSGILSALEHLALRTQLEDTVMLFFSGHGSYAENGDYYLVTHDTKITGTKVALGTGICDVELAYWLRSIKAKRLLLLLNGPHAGNLPSSISSEECIIIASCRQSQNSWISPSSHLSLFGRALFEGFSGKGSVHNNTGYICAYDLYQYIYSEVTGAVQHLGKVQEPELTVLRGRGTFPVALYSEKATPFEDTAMIIKEQSTSQNERTVLQRLDTIEELVKKSLLQASVPLTTEHDLRLEQYKNDKEECEMSENYIDFDLHIAQDGHVTASSSEGQVTTSISTQVPNSLRLAISLIDERRADSDLLKQLGQELYNWLFPGPIHTHFHQTEAAARLVSAILRLRLRIKAEEISVLPLEFLYRKTGGYYIAVNPDTVLSRYLNVPLPPEKVRRREGPLHMLAIIADPTDQTRLPPDEWEVIIKEALAGPLDSDQMTLQTVKRATRKEIRNALLQQKPDIIQFIGHGIYKDGKGYLALVDEKTGETWLMDDERFANLYLGYDDHLGMISLATCESAKSDDPQGFLGIAPKLVQRGTPAVLSMQYKVLIKTAKIFLEGFYTAVAARKPIDWATQSARNAVSQELGLDNREFATPVLYMRAKDGNVF